nr:SKP1/BTB/POZ domain-containing protein [Cedratvirus duvanny]
MQKGDFVLQVFDTDYKLSRSDLQRSRFLRSLFSGRYKEKHFAILDLDQSLQPAFDIVYDYLVMGELTDVPKDLFQDVLFLASYIDSPSLISLLVERIETLPREVLNSCAECLEVPEVRDALFAYYVDSTPYFADLPGWFQTIILERETEDPVQGGELYSRLFNLPPRQSNLFKQNLGSLRDRYAPDYMKRCQGQARPLILNSKQVGLNTSEQRTSYRVDDEFFACSDMYPILKMSNRGELCCGRAKVVDDHIRSYKALQSPFAYLVLVPEDFVGDYIVSTNYTISPQGDVILF